MKQKLVRFIDEKGNDHWPIHVDQVSGYLHYVKKHGGRKIQFTTGCTKEQVNRAKRIANEELAKRMGTKKIVRTQPLIKDEVSLWLDLKGTEGLAEDSLKNIRNGIKQFEPFWGDRFPIDMLNPDIRSEFYAWFSENYPGQQMENAIKQLRSFSGYLCMKVVNGSPILPARPKFSDPNAKTVRRERKKKKKAFTQDEFARVYASAETSEHALAVLIMYTMATRITETLTMQFDREIFLDLPVPEYRWSDGQNKADHDGRHALHPSLIEPLKKLRTRRLLEGTKLLFPQERNNQAPLKEQQIDWKSWRKRAQIDWHWTSHAFRRTCLTLLFSDERNPQALIMKLYRVSLAVALEHYLQTTDSGIEKMRAAIEVKL